MTTTNSQPRSSALLVLGLLAILGIAILAAGMILRNAQTTVDTVTGGAAETYVAWKGTQTLYPNKHAIERHSTDADATVDCYNRNGAFHVMSNANGDFNLLCRDDDDGTVRDVILKRRGNSNIFDFINAYTPKDGTFNSIKYWLENTWKCGKGSMPNDTIIVIDGVIP